MSAATVMLKLAYLHEILRAGKTLEMHGVLPEGETAYDSVKRYVDANPDINEYLAKNSIGLVRHEKPNTTTKA